MFDGATPTATTPKMIRATNTNSPTNHDPNYAPGRQEARLPRHMSPDLARDVPLAESLQSQHAGHANLLPHSTTSICGSTHFGHASHTAATKNNTPSPNHKGFNRDSLLRLSPMTTNNTPKIKERTITQKPIALSPCNRCGSAAALIQYRA